MKCGSARLDEPSPEKTTSASASCTTRSTQQYAFVFAPGGSAPCGPKKSPSQTVGFGSRPSGIPSPSRSCGWTRGIVRDTPFVVTDMSPFRMNSMLAETSAFVSRFCAASDHATRHELDGVSSVDIDETPGTSAARRPVSATNSAERRRGLA